MWDTHNRNTKINHSIASLTIGVGVVEIACTAGATCRLCENPVARACHVQQICVAKARLANAAKAHVQVVVVVLCGSKEGDIYCR